jgi:hypothetical protein
MKRRAGEGGAIHKLHPYEWLWEPLTVEATFVLRSMFGAKAAYLDGKLMLCFMARDEPWRGVLVCTDRSHQPALLAEFPELKPHAILPKWLYLPESADRFENVAVALVGLARRRDTRLGVVPPPRKRRAKPETIHGTKKVQAAKPRSRKKR